MVADIVLKAASWLSADFVTSYSTILINSTYESAREKDRSATPDVDEVPRRNGREDVD